MPCAASFSRPLRRIPAWPSGSSLTNRGASTGWYALWSVSASHVTQRRSRLGPALRGAAQGRARQALDQVEQDRARFVDELVTVAERRDAAKWIHSLEARCLVALPRVNVDGGVVGACLLERRASREAA